MNHTTTPTTHALPIPLGYSLGSMQSPIGFSRKPLLLTPAPLWATPEGHMLIVGATGSGKGVSAAIPAALSYPGLTVIFDPKGENYAVTARQRRTYGPVYVIDPFRLVTSQPDPFNPLDVCQYLPGVSTEEMALMLTQLVCSQALISQKEPFWDMKAQGLITGVIGYVLGLAPEERHLGTVRKLLYSGDSVYNLAVILDTNKTINRMAFQEIAEFLNTTEVTRSGILSTAQAHLQAWLTEARVLESVSATGFDLAAVQQGQPLTLYLVLPATRLTSHKPLLRLWLGSLVQLLLSRTRRPALPTLLLIDEAAQLGEMESVRLMLTLLRGYGVIAALFFQDFSQIRRLYREDYATVINNCGVIHVLGVTTPQMAREAADVLDVPARTLLDLPPDQSVLMQHGKVQRIRKLNYLHDALFADMYTPNPFYR